MMYTRGQFAIIGKVGRKALRLYHEEGLLIPASVNTENGYHYYDESQLKVLEKIKRLRKFGLSLYDIKQVLDGKVLENELVNSKIKEMDVMLQEIKELASSNENAETKTKDGEPDIRSFETCRCLFVEENVELENLGMSVGKLYEKAAREKIKVAGNHFVLYEGFSSENNFSMKTCLPVKDFTGENTLEVTEEKCLHINFTGGFSKIGNAHILIKEYADAHKIKLVDKAYEVYNKDMSVDVYYAVV